MQPGQQVRLGAGRVSVFNIVSVDEDAGTAIIEATADAPGKYPFSARLADLVPAT